MSLSKKTVFKIMQSNAMFMMTSLRLGQAQFN